ncbi:MAG TPA: LysR family transcriptional regulator [Caldimonas sp.]|nr:LysR family transcriptional regulator [Caldimonas sp.]
MDLKRLRHFVALAEERHFARAAERVHLSQPAFSRSIQALEGEAGMPLFDRDAGRPTPAGEFVLARARRLLFDVRNLRRDVDLYRGAALGALAFGVGPFPAATLLPSVLLQLRTAHPGVQLRVEVSNWTLLLDRLLAEDIEFFVADIRDLPVRPELAIAHLGFQLGGLYVRASHPLAGRRCTFAQAWAHGVATSRLPLVVRRALGRLLGLRKGETPAFALECDDVSILRGLALTTDAACALTHAAAKADVAAGRLVPLEVDGLPRLASEMGIVSLQGRTHAPLAVRAIALMGGVARTVNAPAAAA